MKPTNETRYEENNDTPLHALDLGRTDGMSGQQEPFAGRPRRRSGGRGGQPALCRAHSLRHGEGGPRLPAHGIGQPRLALGAPERHERRVGGGLLDGRDRGHQRQVQAVCHVGARQYLAHSSGRSGLRGRRNLPHHGGQERRGRHAARQLEEAAAPSAQRGRATRHRKPLRHQPRDGREAARLAADELQIRGL